jgi:phage/plasmid primase-like uncharacterized protein
MLQELTQFVQKLDYSTEHIVLDGKIKRFDRGGKKNAWLIGFQNHTKKGHLYAVAIFGDWKTNERHMYRPDIKLSKDDERSLNNDIKKITGELELAREEMQKLAALKATEIMNEATSNAKSDYLKQKGLSNLYEAKTIMTPNGRQLCIPMVDENQQLWGIQRIASSGTKFFLEGQKVESCFHVIPDFSSLEKTDVILIAEGFATASSIFEATRIPTVVAFNAGNLKNVAKLLKLKYLEKDFVICGDDDRFNKLPDGTSKNIGRESAMAAAKEIGGEVSFPIFQGNEEGSDFNDVHVSMGLAEVKRQICLDLDKIKSSVQTLYKPDVIVNEGQESDLIDLVSKIVVAQNKRTPSLFRRGNKLTQIYKDDLEKAFIVPTTKDHLVTLLAYSANWTQTRAEGKIANVMVPERLAKHLLTSPPRDLPRLDGVLHLPFFNSDRELVKTNGFHKKDKIFLDTKIDLPEFLFGEKISKDICMKSKKLLYDVCEDFPFLTNADRVNFFTAFFHCITKKLYSGPSPILFINGTRPNTGKTLLAELVWIAQIGAEPVSVGWPTSEEEQEKLINSLFLEGRTIFFFDNLRSNKLDSSVLAKLGTQQTWSGRLLGGNDLLKCPNSAQVIFTVNNLSATTEIARRSPRTRLESPHPSSHKRPLSSFKFPNIRDWMLRNRIEFLTAIYAITKYWIDLGCPPPAHGRYLPSFEGWSETLGGIFEAAEIEGFLEGQDEYTDSLDDEAENMDALLNLWWSFKKDGVVTPSDLLKSSELKEMLLHILGPVNSNAIPSEFGKKLKEWKGRIVGSFKIEQVKDGGQKRGRLYQLVKISGGGGGYQLPIQERKES